MEPYHPLNTLKPIANGIWIVDGPVVRMPYLVGWLPFSTRMTVVRLPDERLWVHSPTGLTPGLQADIGALGDVAALVAPNRLHWLSLGRWQDAFPQATTYVAPGVEAKAKKTGAFDVDTVLGAAPPTEWGGALEQVLVQGRFMTEAVFFHRASRTLILADLIENFEPDRVESGFQRWLMRRGGVLHPDGGTPRDLILTFLPRRGEARLAAERMIGWAPRRIVLSHGRCIDADAGERLCRAFAWTGVRAV